MIRTLFIAAPALIVAACATAPTTTPAPVVAAERAFAEDGYARGVKASFTAYAAPDAVMFAPQRVYVHDFFNAQPDAPPDASRPHLVWWPLAAGISSSGDLGFTTGPYAYDEDRRGYYFTVWQRQPDGEWKWVIDAGVEADAAAAPGRGAPVDYLPVATLGSVSPDTAFSDVMVIEGEMASKAQQDARAAYEGKLAPEARMHTEGLVPATDEASQSASLQVRPATLSLTPLGGGASGAGDLVWTYSSAEWTVGEGPATGFVVRVWQKREAGWQIVFDELI